MSSLLHWFSGLLSHVVFQIQTVLTSGFPAIFWVRPRWSLDDMGNQSGQVVLVTGGNSGVGYVTAKAFYERGATVYLACRSQSKAEAAIAAIKRGDDFHISGFRGIEGRTPLPKTAGRLVFLHLDLADLSSVDRMVTAFEKHESKLDILYANAGIMATTAGLQTEQGYPLQFGSNCLGHHYLISRLLPTLLRTAQSSQSPPRVIVLSSAGHATAPPGGIDYSYIAKSGAASQRRAMNVWVDYGQSKWGNIALANYLNFHYGPRSVANDKLIAVSVHPGTVATNLPAHLAAAQFVLAYLPWLTHLITRPPAIGALNQIWAGACSATEAKRISGSYIVPFQGLGAARSDLRDREKVDALWQWCEEQERRFT